MWCIPLGWTIRNCGLISSSGTKSPRHSSLYSWSVDTSACFSISIFSNPKFSTFCQNDLLKWSYNYRIVFFYQKHRPCLFSLDELWYPIAAMVNFQRHFRKGLEKFSVSFTQCLARTRYDTREKKS